MSQTRLSDFSFTFHFHALEKEMATYSSVLAWRIPGMGEPGGLPSLGLHKVGHDWSDLAVAAAVRYKGVKRQSLLLELSISHHKILYFLPVLVRVSCQEASQIAPVVKNPPANTGDTRDRGLIPGLGRSPGEGYGNSLQYSCLESSADRRTWWGTVQGRKMSALSNHTTLLCQEGYLIHNHHCWSISIFREDFFKKRVMFHIHSYYDNEGILDMIGRTFGNGVLGNNAPQL